jgi:hypothetical protein
MARIIAAVTFVATVVSAIAAVLVVPQFQCWVGLSTCPNPSPPSEQAKWPTDTNDPIINDIDSQLNQLSTNASEGAIAEKLTRFFNRPVFHNLHEGDDNIEALYTYCRAQLLLETYVNSFSDPGVRQKLIDATQNLIYLQDQLGKLYGPTFNRAILCRKHSSTLDMYYHNMPAENFPILQGDGADLFVETLKKLADNLSMAGIPVRGAIY